jgi:protein TonB
MICSFALAASASALTVAEITDVSPKVDEAPAPVRTVAPDYPLSLREARVNGVVSVVLVVDESGDVLAAEVAKSTHDDFTSPALSAIRRWKFKPAKVAGKAVKVKVTIPVRFSAE